jgi:beta-phosphoglucomutase-like phosphatase (HAD superfamily)
LKAIVLDWDVDSLSGIQAAVATSMTPIGFFGGGRIGPGRTEGLAGAAMVTAEMREVLEWINPT